MDFDRIYSEYFQDVFYYLRSLSSNQEIAEDLTQETFVKAMKGLDRYDGQKDIRAWLFTIAKNSFIDRCRKEKHCSKQEFQPELFADPAPCFVEKMMDQADAFQIHQILHELSEPYKEVFSLRTFGELSFEQIGKLFGKGAGWARVTYYRAKQKILNRWEELNHE